MGIFEPEYDKSFVNTFINNESFFFFGVGVLHKTQTVIN